MVRRWRGWMSIGILCGSAGVSAAQPAGAPITLQWDAPSGGECPSGDAVRAEVERLLGGKPSAGAGRRLSARAQVAQVEGGTWELTLRTSIAGEEGEGERTLHAPSCEALAGAAALIVALGFDPAAVAAQAERRATAPPPGPTAGVGGAPPAPPSGPPVPAPSVSPRSAAPAFPQRPAAAALPQRLAAPAGLGAGGDVGTLSAAAYSVNAWGSLRYRQLQLAATAAYFPPHRTSMPDRQSAGGTFTLISGGLSACGALLDTRRRPESAAGSLELAACAGGEIGQMRAEGYGVRAPDEGAALWLALRAAGVVTAVLTDTVALRLEVGAVVPLGQSRFYLEPIGVVHEPSAVCGRAGAGVEVRF